jgi:hypothetical protein
MDQSHMSPTLMISGTMGTMYHGLRGRNRGATMSQSTRPKDPGQVAHNRGGLEDRCGTKSLNGTSRDRV